MYFGYRVAVPLTLYHYLLYSIFSHLSNDLIGKWENNSIFFEKNFLNKCSFFLMQRSKKISYPPAFAVDKMEFLNHKKVPDEGGAWFKNGILATAAKARIRYLLTSLH